MNNSMSGLRLGTRTEAEYRTECATAAAAELNSSERHELECLRARVKQLAYPCSPHCDGYLRELALRNSRARDAQTTGETGELRI